MRTAAVVALSSFLCAGTARAASTDPPPIYRQVTGEEAVHVVAQGETLGQISRHFGMTTELAATVNRLSDANRLHLGQRLLVSNRHIVPASISDGLVINVGDLTLYWLRDSVVLGAFPVGVGRIAWETPPGHYSIISRRHDPVWHVPPKIQREMREQGLPVKQVVPPGPDNPLGKYWLQLSLPGYGIHGTNAPRSVGKYTTHGCIRMRADDNERLYHEVPNGTAVEIIDEPIKVAQLDSGTVLLEAHPRTFANAAAVFLERLHVSDLAERVDMAAAERVLTNAWGIAMEVTKKGSPPATQSTKAEMTGTRE